MESRKPRSGVFIGEGTLLVRCADVFLNAGHRVALVVSSNRVIRDWADERQIDHVAADADLVPLLADVAPDYLFSVANMAIIKEDVLRLARHMAINFHDGLLPRYAGVHATSWALINRETSHGVTWHEMLASVDRGRILKQRAFEIAPGETAVSLNARCYEAGIESFAELVDDLSTDRLAPRDQRFEERTYFASEKRPPDGCTISWDRPAEETAALIAALMFGPTDNPLGLPKVELGVGTVVARESTVLKTRSDAAPGTVIAVDREAVRVATATYDLALGGFQTLDGQPLPVHELAERFEVRPGSRLPGLSAKRAARLTSVHRGIARHEAYWVNRLAHVEMLELPYANRAVSTPQ